MDIDPRFGDIEEIGPIEDLQEVRLEEEDPTRVVKVGINFVYSNFYSDDVA